MARMVGRRAGAENRTAGNGIVSLPEHRPTRGRLRLLAVFAIFLLAAVAGSSSAQALPAGGGAAVVFAETNKAPKVTKQPASLTVEEGQGATFSSTASGVPTPTVQWELSTNGGGSWSPIEGATAGSLTIASTETSETGYQFRAVYKNIVGEATSKAATLTVQKAPAVTKQPAEHHRRRRPERGLRSDRVGFPGRRRSSGKPRPTAAKPGQRSPGARRAR